MNSFRMVTEARDKFEVDIKEVKCFKWGRVLRDTVEIEGLVRMCVKGKA